MKNRMQIMAESNHNYVAIMAGGVGSRFWPASREARPKQFLDILGVGKSLLRLTFERFQKLVPAENIFIVTNGQYAAQVREQLPEIGGNQVLCEPSRNNTAPCVAYAAFKLQALHPEANMVVAPSDHLILDEDTFLDTLRQALAFTARNEALLTLGIQPTRPDTGYGYIKYEAGSGKSEVGSGPAVAKASAGNKSEEGPPSPMLRRQNREIYRVERFTEKPPLEQAEEFVASGDYLWNAGIFVWRAAEVLRAFREYAAEIYDILAAGAGQYNTAQEQAFIDEAYPATPSISVDYAIMERADNVFTIPSSFGWSDLGTWNSLHAVADKDPHGNVASYYATGGPEAPAATGKQLTYKLSDCLLRLPAGKLLVARDLSGYIIVDEGDVLLLWPKDHEQEIKRVTREVRERFGDQFL
jgi:mannose-1-phosphate guanylyltransferase